MSTSASLDGPMDTGILAKAKSLYSNSDWGKYRNYIYTTVTFVSSLIVLVFCVVLLILIALAYDKILSIISTIDNIQAKVDGLLSSSWADIIVAIINAIAQLLRISTTRNGLSGEEITKLTLYLQDRAMNSEIDLVETNESIKTYLREGHRLGFAEREGSITTAEVVDALEAFKLLK